MKKGSAYILLLLFILHNTTFDQLLKLPALVTHYHDHQQRNRDISVMDYLCMHYWGEDNDNDDEQDRQLPYKNVDFSTIQLSYIPLAKVITIRQQEHRSLDIHYPVLKDNYFPEPAMRALFRPPKA
ncbi:hypothetical protein [Chitinophaga sp. MM2321]|uniref:hypothetical protein n=1 Tax=Chitinophaga sp. MM2321 TaxID=3137178 RepID=UPI0032D58FD1